MSSVGCTLIFRARILLRGDMFYIKLIDIDFVHVKKFVEFVEFLYNL